MRWSYLLFDLLVFVPAFVSSFIPRVGFSKQRRPLFWACFAAAVPFIIWDAAVVGRHWFFADTHTLGLRIWQLPIEELLFFVAVPWACVYSWETLLFGAKSRSSPSLAWAHAIGWVLAALSAAALHAGREYTSFALAALAAAIVLDRALGTALVEQPRFWLFMGFVGALGLAFNGYLTRFVVTYDDRYNLGLRLTTVPLEDFIYGAALVSLATVLYQWQLGRRPRPSWLARLIERRLGGYRQAFNVVDEKAPLRLSKERTVAVVGGGLAGLSAAALLAERGFRVTLLEKNGYLGGKLGAWRERLPDGFEADVEHGFHAFFRHYYNLSAFLERVGVRKLASIGSYVILARQGQRWAFDERDRVPLLNLLALARKGLYSLREVALGPARRQLEAFLRYDAATTFVEHDHQAFSDFVARAKLPANLRMVFSTFARAFFAEDADLSTAELIKSFHFYYLSHDRGLVYDYLDGRYDADLLSPIAEHLRQHRVEVQLSTAVDSLDREGLAFRINGRPFEHVVVATDVEAARGLLGRSQWVAQEAPVLARQMQAMKAGARYAVWRLWLDRRAGDELPVFVSIERRSVLDAVVFVDRIDPRCGAWAKEHRGSVIELHSYSLTGAAPDEAAVRSALRSDLDQVLPALTGATVLHQHLQVRRDFNALHVGMRRQRPGVVTEVNGLLLAGDWVALPTPAMLMEAAHTSGLLAANTLCRAHGLREDPVFTVPLTGVLAARPRR